MASSASSQKYCETAAGKYLLREDFSVSYPTIGTKLGGRDHTTVIHSCEKIKREVVDDTTLAKEIQDVRSLLV